MYATPSPSPMTLIPYREKVPNNKEESSLTGTTVEQSDKVNKETQIPIFLHGRANLS